MGIMAHLKSGAYWWGVATVLVGLWLFKNYGDRLPRLPMGSGG